jgi:hypothetical protein
VPIIPISGARWCPVCEEPMELYQPDESHPTQLLGACATCSRWFVVIEIEDHDSNAFLVELPGAERLREIIEASLGRAF